MIRVLKLYRRPFFWIGLGISAVLVRWIAGFYPATVEQCYSRGVFAFIRWCIDYLLAWSPVPLIYLFVALFFFFTGRSIARFWRSEARPIEKYSRGILNISAFLGGGIFFFLFLWGYNYSRMPVEELLDIHPQALTYEELWSELELETEYLYVLRQKLNADTLTPLTNKELPERMEPLLRQDLEAVLASYGIPHPGRVRGRLLYPKGVFLRFSSSGLYFPFTGEGHVDAGLHPLQQPSVMAHEMAHGYGFGDEGSCSFLAYLACRRSKDPFVAYAGHLSYWRTLAANCLRYEPQRYQQFRAGLPPGIQADLDAINENLSRYPDLMPRLRYYAYDTYLKAQGIEEGMKNYSRVIMLVKAWRKG